MGLKAFIPAGQTALTVNGLHQWDYGRKLEIHDDSLPALIEVHFAFGGMKDAIVRSCSVLQGVAETTIPDLCLEQTAPITAYIYEVGENSGATTKVIVLTVTPRPRPQIAGALTPTISDKYTELMGAVNEQVNALKTGNVTVSKALTADSAVYTERAGSAGRADTADAITKPETIEVGFATNSGYADEARWSETSELAAKAKQMKIIRSLTPNSQITIPGLYLVVYRSTTQTHLEHCELLNITYLSNTAYGSGGQVPSDYDTLIYKGPAYNPDRTNMTNTITLRNMSGYEITTIWLLAAYDVE